MPTYQCPQGHEIRSITDRDNGGYCRRCRSEREKRRRIGKSAAWTVVRAFESAGVHFQHDGVPVEPAEVVRQLAEAYAAGAFDTHPD
ncbi:hypothetical protein [Rhodococcus sp. LB1]|uniref:hypothetical protein n=1 Tax=Rhodococcus sp. LB1 TaxID=1807499 RepID=UPI00077A1A9E|nr:hypothetical protein [Rhodococcus sp. LB1]KXX62298.1 hypothetical protein AZG88_29870 [Rhodococcus sp. LB1]